jgi:uncharacterized protein (TIGR03067 family)
VGKAERPRIDQAGIQRLIRQLGSDSFKEREAASRDLAAIGESAEQALRRALLDSDLEIRRRATRLLHTLAGRIRAREVAALQGLWVLKTTEYLGEQADQDPTEDELEKLFARQRDPVEKREVVADARQRRTTLAFKGETFEQRQWIVPVYGGAGRVISIRGTYQLDVDQSPKAMERIWEEDTNLRRTHAAYCIYSVQGDTLLMCVNFNNDPGHLPTEFATGVNEDVALLTFKRERSQQ